jgi:hypothetical protein
MKVIRRMVSGPKEPTKAKAMNRNSRVKAATAILAGVRRSLVFSVVVLAMACGSAVTAQAQAADISVDPDTVAPGAAVTVTVAGAPSGEPVVVQLGTEEESATTDASGGATVTIAAPNAPGEALGTVRVGLVDFPIQVVVQVAADTTTTAAATTTAATTTVPPPPPTQPVTGLDDTGTMIGLGMALMAAGLWLTAIARRPAVAIVTRGSTTEYRIVDGYRSGESTRK